MAAVSDTCKVREGLSSGKLGMGFWPVLSPELVGLIPFPWLMRDRGCGPCLRAVPTVLRHLNERPFGLKAFTAKAFEAPVNAWQLLNWRWQRAEPLGESHGGDVASDDGAFVFSEEATAFGEEALAFGIRKGGNVLGTKDKYRFVLCDFGEGWAGELEGHGVMNRMGHGKTGSGWRSSTSLVQFMRLLSSPNCNPQEIGRRSQTLPENGVTQNPAVSWLGRIELFQPSKL